MINSLMRRWICICALGISLSASAAAFAQIPGVAQPTAQDLYDYGSELYQKGRVLEAKPVLLRIDLAQLGVAQRGDVRRLLARIEAEINALPISDLRLQKASLALATRDYRNAGAHLAAVARIGDLTPEQETELQRLTELVQAAKEQVGPLVPEMLKTAVDDFDAARYAQAKSGLRAVYNSGIDLNLDQQAELNLYLTRIIELEQARNEFFAEAPINIGAIEGEVTPALTLDEGDQPVADAAEPEGDAEDEPTPAQPEPQGGDLPFNESPLDPGAAENLAPVKEAEEEDQPGRALPYADSPLGQEQPPPAQQEEPPPAAEPEQEPPAEPEQAPAETGEQEQEPPAQAGDDDQQAPPREPLAPADELIRQAMQAEAAKNLQLGQQAIDARRFADAINYFQQALQLQPDNEPARIGLDQAQRMRNAGPILEEQLVQDQIQSQQLQAEFDNLMSQAAARLDVANFDQAFDLVTRAKLKIDEGRALLPTDEYQARRNAAQRLADRINTARREAQTAEAQEQAQEIQDLRDAEEEKLRLQKKRQITEKLVNIRKLQQAQKYHECLQEIESLLFIEPGNPAALALQATIQDLLIYLDYQRYSQKLGRRIAELDVENLKSTIPPTDIVEYPEDWPELTLRRSDSFAFLRSQADRQVWAALENTRIPVEFQGHRFADVLNHIKQVASINMIVDWRSLEQEFIDRDTPVNLSLNDSVPLQVVLERVLEQLGDDPQSRPHYAISDGILKISTKDSLQKDRVAHVYYIRDLLFNVPRFDDAPKFDLDSILDRTHRRENGDRLFGEAPDQTDYLREQISESEMIDKIRQIITSVVDPGSWELNGGEVGVIQDLNGNLIITTTVTNHQEVSNLLEKLREIRSLQISVDSRILLVNEDFFEQIGFDVDLFWGGAAFNRDSREDPNLLPSDLFVDPRTGQFNPQAQRQYISIFDLIPRVDATGAPVLDANGRQIIDEIFPDAGVFALGRHTFGPQSLQGGSLNLANALFGAGGNSFAGQAMALDPGLSYAVSFLDEIQVDLLIEATQADRRSVQLTQPRLTFFNGQQAFVQLTTSRFFISDLQPVVGDSSAGFDPTLSTLREGAVLDIEGVVSADRRYVTMTVVLGLAQILDIETTSLPVLVGGQVVLSGQQSDVTIGEAFIERPVVQVSRVSTTVNVPDRGTILLGGQTIRNDIEIETGVPVLSKIPIINRFFTNRIMTTEERTLMILIKPTIIIQEENEERLFPGLHDAIRSGGLGYNGRF